MKKKSCRTLNELFTVLYLPHWVPLTPSSVTTSTQLQYTGSRLHRVQLQRAPGYNELGYGYNEHPATMSSVIMSTQLQYTGSHLHWVWFVEHLLLCFKIVDCNVKKFGYKSTHLQRVRLQRLQRADFFASKSFTAMLKKLIPIHEHMLTSSKNY